MKKAKCNNGISPDTRSQRSIDGHGGLSSKLSGLLPRDAISSRKRSSGLCPLKGDAEAVSMQEWRSPCTKMLEEEKKGRGERAAFIKLCGASGTRSG